MRKCLLPTLLLMLLFLAACGAPDGAASPEQDTTLKVVASTYPSYLFLSALTQNAEGITVRPLINQQVSCLHDYSLTVAEMKVLESADALFTNGVGLDSFIAKAAAESNADCLIFDGSTGIDLLPLGAGEGDQDPHYWLDPNRAVVLLNNMRDGLIALDPAQAALYQKNAVEAAQTLQERYANLNDKLAPLQNRNLITFHDGFSYFADAFDLNILLAVEEEEGQEASAQVISHALSLIARYQIPAIFTEEYSSDATALAIAREANIQVQPLSLMMSGKADQVGLDPYLNTLTQNVDSILEALS